MQVLGERIADCFALRYYGNLFNLLNLYRPKHMYEPVHLNNASTIVGRPMKGVD